MRPSGRTPSQLRPIEIVRGPSAHAEGSAMISCGGTRVLCTASIEERAPAWKRDEGWLTAEYGMLPRATHKRSKREAATGKQSGRTQEIQRLIGRSLRSVLDLSVLAGLTITIDCDVLQADGGTRTASITGGYVALAQAVDTAMRRGILRASPLHGQVAAVSVGIYRGAPVLDLDYEEDSACETDMNVVMNDASQYVEIQGTAEGHAFRRDELDAMLVLAQGGVRDLLDAQRSALAR